MSNESIKLKEEHSKKIDDFQIKYNKLIGQVGQLELQFMDIERTIKEMKKNKEELSNSYENIKQEEQDFLNSLQKEYGAGNIDIKTKVFYPEKNL